ncbi:hypothetical protein Taro_019066 [Colocasia esculenta]|uniref:Uncharacterized protein n=1 Tax=Colocasia esculenta TaxID=4460 RepID=A0A843UK76_COLES|nr:hypothetical protein [Colocasia esculenta]
MKVSILKSHKNCRGWRGMAGPISCLLEASPTGPPSLLSRHWNLSRDMAAFLLLSASPLPRGGRRQRANLCASFVSPNGGNCP